jgi:hypothetical protein
MTPSPAPRLALALLERLVPDSEPLAGDLLEEFERRQSVLWLWWQVLGASATALFARSVEIRPLRLVDVQPADALERSRRMSLRFPPVNLTASPIAGVSGLGLVIFAGLVTMFAPAAWWLLVASALAGVLLGILIIAWRAGPATTTGYPPFIRADAASGAPPPCTGPYC